MEPPIELPPDPKKLKCMKKKLDELNRKIRHSRKKHDGLIHKRNSLRKVIRELKRGNTKQPTIEAEQGFVDMSELLVGLTGVIASMVDPEWMRIHSLTTSEEISST